MLSVPSRGRRLFSQAAGTIEQLQKQKEEFEELKKSLFQLSEAQEATGQGEEESEAPPKRLTDVKKVDFLMQCDRTVIDFRKEIHSLYAHEETFERKRVSALMNNVYIPKFKAKGFASYLYGGENDQTYNNYEVSVNEPNEVFSRPDRSKEELILGIETSFDETACSLVNSFGEVKANHQMT